MESPRDSTTKWRPSAARPMASATLKITGSACRCSVLNYSWDRGCPRNWRTADGQPIFGLIASFSKWSGRGDLNARPPAPKAENTIFINRAKSMDLTQNKADVLDLVYW